MSYASYLRSREWLARREWALERAGRRCQVCNGGSRLEVHHRSYDNLGAELPGDLLVLCSDCHGIYHQSGKLAASVEAEFDQAMQRMISARRGSAA